MKSKFKMIGHNDIFVTGDAEVKRRTETIKKMDIVPVTIEEIESGKPYEFAIEKRGLTSSVLDDIPIKKVVNSKNAYLRKFPYNNCPIRKIQYGIIVTIIEEYGDYYRIDPSIIYQPNVNWKYCWIAKSDLRDPVIM